jgi:hypothetical protein
MISVVHDLSLCVQQHGILAHGSPADAYGVGSSVLLQVQRFQQWQSDHKVAKKQAQQLADVQDALMTQLAVQEADARVSQYSQLLLEETQRRGLSTQPVALHVVRAAKQLSALTPSM